MENKTEPTAWMCPGAVEPEFTADALIAGYWMRKGRTVVPLYAGNSGAAPGDALDAATKYKAEQRSMIIGQAVAHCAFIWPLGNAESMWLNGALITKAEFEERAAIATSTSKGKKNEN